MSPRNTSQYLSRYSIPSSPKVLSAPGSPMASLPPVPSSPFDLPTYDIPSLEKVLARTHQPHLRKRLEEMIALKREEEGRGSPNRGWQSRAPQRGQPRHQLMSECGKACFLDPESGAFPVCPKCTLGDSHCLCQLDCGGLMSAKIRAKQYHKEDIAELAEKLLQYKCNK